MDFALHQTRADAYALHWWAHRLSPSLERRFARETDAARNRQIRLWIAVGLGFSWLTFVFDLVCIPDAWRLAFLLRLCFVTPVSLVAMRLLRTTQPRSLEALANVVPPAASLVAVLLGFAASAVVDPFRSALVLSIGILWTNVLMPMRFQDALVFTVLMLLLGDGINITALHLNHAVVDHPEVIITTHVLVALSILARFIAERESRRNFLLGLGLQLHAETLARSNARLLEISNTDPLTGLANRRFFDSALAQAWQTAAATQSWIAIMMIDVDHFKRFNDAAGHLEGDRCLTTIAHAIADHVRRDRDLAGRFGGEEFVVLMPATDDNEASIVAERVRSAIGALQLFHPGSALASTSTSTRASTRASTGASTRGSAGHGFVTVSIGVAAIKGGTPGGTSTTLLAAADTALYAAKAAGRDQVMQAERAVLPYRGSPHDLSQTAG